jgi:hypothetical protein
MTKVLLRDPLFLGSVVAVALTTGTLLWRHVDFSFLHSRPEPALSAQARIDNLPNTPGKAILTTWQAPRTATAAPTASGASASTYSSMEKKCEVKKSRPQNGTTWVLAKEAGEGIDATDLQLIIANAEDNDKLLIKSGVYDGTFNGVPDGMEITGEEDVIIKLGDQSFSKMKILSLKNLTLQTGDRNYFSVDGWSSVLSLENVTVTTSGSNGRFYLGDGVTFKAKNSTFKHVTLNARQGTSVDIEDSSFTKADHFLDLEGAKNVGIRRCVFDTFSSWAVTVGAVEDFKIADSKFANGEFVFYASSGTKVGRVWGERLTFSNLKYAEYDNVKMSCENCNLNGIPWSRSEYYARRR